MSKNYGRKEEKKIKLNNNIENLEAETTNQEINNFETLFCLNIITPKLQIRNQTQKRILLDLYFEIHKYISNFSQWMRFDLIYDLSKK